jgi:hypothetical protein
MPANATSAMPANADTLHGGSCVTQAEDNHRCLAYIRGSCCTASKIFCNTTSTARLPVAVPLCSTVWFQMASNAGSVSPSLHSPQRSSPPPSPQAHPAVWGQAPASAQAPAERNYRGSLLACLLAKVEAYASMNNSIAPNSSYDS